MKRIALVLTIVTIAILFLVIVPMARATAIPEKCQNISFKAPDGKTYTRADFKGKLSF